MRAALTWCLLHRKLESVWGVGRGHQEVLQANTCWGTIAHGRCHPRCAWSTAQAPARPSRRRCCSCCLWQMRTARAAVRWGLYCP